MKKEKFDSLLFGCCLFSSRVIKTVDAENGEDIVKIFNMISNLPWLENGGVAIAIVLGLAILFMISLVMVQWMKTNRRISKIEAYVRKNEAARRNFEE